jgi:cell division protein FtsQ
VVERQPVAFVRQGQQIGLVDANGVLLTMPAAMMAQHHYSFPVVTGIDPRDPLDARKGRMAVYGRLLAELDANNQHLSEQISEIDLTDPEDARVLMPEQGEDILAHFGEDRFLERYQRYKAHIAEWRQQYPKLAAVDLRYDQQVVLQMTPDANGAQVTAGGETASNESETKPTTEEPAGKGNPKAAEAKDRTAQGKAAKDNKKRTEAKRTSLGVNRRKPAPKAHPEAVARQGE